LAGDSVIYSLGTVLGKVVALALLPVVTRALDPAGFGRLETLSTAFTAIAALLLLGFDVSSARAFSLMQPDRRSEVTSTWLLIALALAAVATTLCLLFQSQVANLLLDDDGFRFAARWIGPVVAVSLLRSFVLGTLRNERLPRMYAAVSGASISVTAVLMAVAAMTKPTVESLLVAQAVGVGIVAIAGLFYVRRFLTSGPSLLAAKLILRFGVPLAPLIGLVAVGDLATRTILLRTASESEVGLLGVAVRVGSILTICGAGALVAFQPRAFDLATGPAGREEIGKDIQRIFSLLSVVAIGLAVVSPFIVVVVAGDAYRSAAQVAGLVLVSALGAGLFQFLSIGLMIDGRTGRISAATLVGVGSTVALVTVLAPAYGAVGAAAAMSVGSWVSVALICVASRGGFFPQIAWFQIAPTVVAAGLAVLLLSSSSNFALKALALVLVLSTLHVSSVLNDGLALAKELVTKSRSRRG